MIIINTLQPEKKIELSSKNEIVFTRIKHLFNHHSFVNYIVVQSEEDGHLLRYSTLNQPYKDFNYLSVILKPKRYDIDALKYIIDNGSATLNHLPATKRELHKNYTLPDIGSMPKIAETDFTGEYFTEGFSTPCITEASIKLGLFYDSHVQIVKNEMVLVKFKVSFLAYDQIGLNRLTSPLLSVKDAVQPITNSIHHSTQGVHRKAI